MRLCACMQVLDFLKSAEVDLTETEHAVSILACQHAADQTKAEQILKRVGAELTHLHPTTILAAETYFRQALLHKACLHCLECFSLQLACLCFHSCLDNRVWTLAARLPRCHIHLESQESHGLINGQKCRDELESNYPSLFTYTIRLRV